jgi:D-xylose transport system permease protein
LLVAQIDLSVGSVSGLSAALLATTFVLNGWPVILSILTSLGAGALIGLFYAQVFNRFGVPSFVITLAGLLAFLGVQLYILGAQGSINLPFDSPPAAASRNGVRTRIQASSPMASGCGPSTK